MRCSRHPSDLTSTIGVCATCLRERLFILVAAQVVQARQQSDHEENRKPEQPLIFPRSVSPYHRGKRENNSDGRFFCTPQIGPTFNSSSYNHHHHGGAGANHGRSKRKKIKSLFANIFHYRSGNNSFDSDLVDPRTSTHSASAASLSSSTSSPSWFSFLHRRKHLDSSTSSAATSIPNTSVCQTATRRSYPQNRGMSPNIPDDPLCFNDEEAGYSSQETSPGWRKSATACTTTPATMSGNHRRGRMGVQNHHHHHHHNRNLSGLAYCLSPLVRAKESSVVTGNVIGIPGEICQKPHLSMAATYCANRSRKLADFGRQNYNVNNNCKNNWR